MPQATYTKLQSGEWGARIQGPPPQPGTTITITKKSGETKTETIHKIVWQGQGVTLASLRSANNATDDYGRTTEPSPRKRRSWGQGFREPCSNCGQRSCSGAYGGLCDED